MKNHTLFLCVLALLLTGCRASRLVVETRERVLDVFTLPTGESSDMTVSIEYPVKGPQCLLDSITTFLDESFGRYLVSGFPAGEDYEFHCLAVKVAARTDAYVTYEIDRIFFGEGLEILMDWVTFARSDGHRLPEIISEAALVRFYKEHPEYRSRDIWEHVVWTSREYDHPLEIGGTVGLLKDTVIHQYVYAQGIYEEVVIPLKAIAPYLSEETRRLIL